jgi:hypothetical protein
MTEISQNCNFFLKLMMSSKIDIQIAPFALFISQLRVHNIYANERKKLQTRPACLQQIEGVCRAAGLAPTHSCRSNRRCHPVIAPAEYLGQSDSPRLQSCCIFAGNQKKLRQKVFPSRAAAPSGIYLAE